MIRASEAGGGGDCLYHSFGAALEQMLLRSPEAARHVHDKIPAEVFASGKTAVVVFLRRLSASAMDDWPPETFLDYVVSRAMDARLGFFQDDWDPHELLQVCGFGCLTGCESVLAYGDAPEGDPGDATCRIVLSDPHRGGASEERLVFLAKDIRVWRRSAAA